VDLLWRGLLEALRLLAHADPQLRQIIVRSLSVSLTATLLATLVGVPTGVALGTLRFRGRRLLQTLVNTGMGLPPVVVGLVVIILVFPRGRLLSRRWRPVGWALGAGFAGQLDKPFDERRLFAAIETAIGRRVPTTPSAPPVR